MSVCQLDDCTHYGCELRRKGIRLSAKIVPSQRNMKPTVQPVPTVNGEIIYDERPGGYKMPLMKPDGTVVRRKWYRDNQSKVESIRRSVRNDTSAQGA